MSRLQPEIPVLAPAQPARSAQPAHQAARPPADAAAALLSLTKPRIAALVVLTAVIPHALAGGTAGSTVVTAAATALLAAGIFALNQYLERDVDGRMNRTRRRALPSGLAAPALALGFGGVSVAAALALLAWTLPLLAAAVGLFTAVSYLWVYTPLKRVTVWHTAIGALPGATPPLLGWAAATGTLPVDAWVLAAILLFWQFPHFVAIEMIYTDDYASADLKVLPVVDRAGVLTRLHIVVPLCLLLAVSLLPAVTGLARPLYAAAALPAGVWFLVSGVRVAVAGGGAEARKLLRASVLYLPLVFGLLALLRS
jgi:protoheme IX farnesyltransferase